MLHLSEFVRTLRSSVLVVFNNFLLIDATDRSKISGDQKRFFIALSLYPLSFFAKTPFKGPVVNRVLHGGSLEITVTVPLKVTLKFVDSPFEIKNLSIIIYYFHTFTSNPYFLCLTGVSCGVT